MKKLFNFAIVLLLVFAIAGCETFTGSENPSDENLSFPTLEPCTKKLIESNQSFICLKEQQGPDLIQTNIKFDADSYNLNDQAKQILNKLYAYLKLTDTTTFTIRGYAGKVESKLLTDKNILTEYNIRLSKNRAESVEEYLVRRGLDKTMVL